jgi:hypothetical protein
MRFSAARYSKLRSDERLQLDRSLRIFAIGGCARPVGLHQHIVQSCVNRIIGPKLNDLVVAQSSSVAQLWKNARTEKVVRDHFSYFSGDQVSTWIKVIDFLKET